jgi:hypothetical protein
MNESIRICHLYPDLLNLYGDRGNIIALEYRAKLRGINVEIIPVTIGDKIDTNLYDIVFFGGGQDAEQNIIRNDFVMEKGEIIRGAVEKGSVFLCICGGYQMMGNYYEGHDGTRINGLGAIDIHTIGRKQRMIGNTVYRCELFQEDPLLFGFENHSGRTILGEGVLPLASVVVGGGNNGEDKTEGAIYKNVFCTYSHGSFLPKNPRMTDHLLSIALKRRYGERFLLASADAVIEDLAREQIRASHKNV